MIERILTIMVKEFRQILRNSRMKTMIFISPLVQVLVFGYAATTDIREVPTAVYDLDKTPASREMIRQFTYSRYFNVKYYLTSESRQKEVIDRSLVNAVIRLERGFAGDLEGGRSASLQLIVDGADSNTASVVLGYATGIIERYSYERFNDRAMILLRGGNGYPAVDLRSRAWFNENLESRNFYIPGVIALLVTLMTLLLTAMAIVKEKELGTIEQLMVSPLRPIEFILGKLAPFAIIGLMDVVFITAVGVLWFKVPIRGNIALLFGSTLVYLLTSLGVGLFISTVASTQQEAMMSTFLFLFPANLLSGFIFPLANMPQFIQYITYLNPLRYFIVILRGIFLKGTGVAILWPNLLVLLVMGIIIFSLSSLRFHKRLG